MSCICLCVGRQFAREEESAVSQPEPVVDGNAVANPKTGDDHQVEPVGIQDRPETPRADTTNHGPENAVLATPQKDLVGDIGCDDPTATFWLKHASDMKGNKEDSIDDTSAELNELSSPQLRVVVDTRSTNMDDGMGISLSQRFKQASMNRMIAETTERRAMSEETKSPATPNYNSTPNNRAFNNASIPEPQVRQEPSIMPLSSSQQLEAQRLMQVLADVSMDMGPAMSSRFTPLHSSRSMIGSSPKVTTPSLIPRMAADISEIPSTPRRLQAARDGRSRPSTTRVAYYSAQYMHPTPMSSRLLARGFSTSRFQDLSTPRGASCMYPANFTMIPHAPPGGAPLTAPSCMAMHGSAPSKIPSLKTAVAC